MTSFPNFLRVQQTFDAPACDDVSAETQQSLAKLNLANRIQPRDRVAITAGSRGISNLAPIIKAIADHFSGLGASPFIVPAMGSHGGGTEEGQERVLESYGVTESGCGCPVESSLETVVIGEAEEGFPIYFDKLAFEADHVVVCNRVKPHTNFSGDIQSGLMKMMMIGLGKKDGATLYHRAIYDHGFPQIIRSVAPQVVKCANILCGVAIVENSLDETAKIEAVFPEDFETRESELLKLAREWMPQLPFDDVDVLLVDRIGKNISGTGMDTNVIGRKHSEPDIGPNIRRIVVRGLTKETHGNATGIGFAEFCLAGVLDGMDRDATVLNCLTALDISAAKVPVHYATDREAISAALATLGLTPPSEAKVVRIRDTGHLAEFDCSEAYRSNIDDNSRLQVVAGPQPLSFDDSGLLPDWA